MRNCPICVVFFSPSLPSLAFQRGPGWCLGFESVRDIRDERLVGPPSAPHPAKLSTFSEAFPSNDDIFSDVMETFVPPVHLAHHLVHQRRERVVRKASREVGQETGIRPSQPRSQPTRMEWQRWSSLKST